MHTNASTPHAHAHRNVQVCIYTYLHMYIHTHGMIKVNGQVQVTCMITANRYL